MLEGWRISEEYTESKQKEFVLKMVEETLKKPRPKVIPSTIQEPSTRAILERDPSKDEEHWNRPLPDEVDWKRDYTDLRNITPDEYIIFNAMRHAANRNEIGKTNESSIDEEKREKGIQAFTYSRPADLSQEDKERIVKLIGIESKPIEYVPPKKERWYSKLFTSIKLKRTKERPPEHHGPSEELLKQIESLKKVIK